MVPFVTAGYVPSTTAVASSLPLTALLGLLPLVLFFVLLGVFKVPTHWCAVASLVTALLVAVFGFNMPADLSLLSATQGAAFGFLPILYIVIMAVWIYNLTERSGRSEDVRMVFSVMGKGDQRVQALLIGFCFCGLLRGPSRFRCASCHRLRHAPCHRHPTCESGTDRHGGQRLERGLWRHGDSGGHCGSARRFHPRDRR